MYLLFKIVGGAYDGRIVAENNENSHKIILATPTLKTVYGVRMLSCDENDNNLGVSFIPVPIKEIYKLYDHLTKDLRKEFFLSSGMYKSSNFASNAGIGKTYVAGSVETEELGMGWMNFPLSISFNFSKSNMGK